MSPRTGKFATPTSSSRSFSLVSCLKAADRRGAAGSNNHEFVMLDKFPRRSLYREARLALVNISEGVSARRVALSAGLPEDGIAELSKRLESPDLEDKALGSRAEEGEAGDEL